MSIAAGPFTLSDNLEYDTLRELVSKFTRDKPDVVVLMGPFVPESHPHIKDGLSDLAPDDIFKYKVVPLLESLREGLHSHARIALIPSAEDFCLPLACYPQPVPDKMSQIFLGVPQSVEFWPNPAKVVINGTSFVFNNVDSLLHVGSEEIA
ncbi:DNA-directed DNA polymerase alpha subunit pol12, partial [Spiromyces aspiralis]